MPSRILSYRTFLSLMIHDQKKDVVTFMYLLVVESNPSPAVLCPAPDSKALGRS
jgi:hypothetical protein